MSGTNPVLSLSVEDNISPGAKAAADALNKVADAADVAETKVGRVSATASTLVNRFDPATKAANALAKAQNDLAVSGETLSRGLQAGTISQQQYDASMATLQTKVRALSEAHTNDLTPALQGTSLRLGQIAPQFVQLFTSIQAGQPVLTSLLAQGHQLGDQMLVTGTSVSQLAGVMGGALKSALTALVSPIGLAVTGTALLVGGVYAVTSAAEASASRLATLQQQLRSTRDSYGAMADEATRAAKAVAANSNISTADARSGAQIIAANPNFTGTQAQLQSLIVLGADLARVMATDVPSGEKLLANAMSDAGKVAQDLASQHIAGLNQSLVDQIKNMTSAGNNAQAFGVLVDALKGKFDGASKAGSPLEKALHDLDQAFTATDQANKSFLERLGDPLAGAIAGGVEQIAKLVSALNTGKLSWTDFGNAAQTAIGALNPTLGLGMIASGVAGGLLSSGGSGTTSPALRTDLANQIQALAEANHILPEVADFAQRIVALGERSPGQFNSSGGVLTSPAGALGLFQVMPDVAGGTTRTVGGQSYDLTQQATNTQAGLAILQQLYTQFGGDLSKVAVGYNAGPGVATGQVHQGPKAYDETTAYLQRLGLTDPRAGGATILPPVDTTASRHGVTNATPTPIDLSGTLPAQIQANQALQANLQGQLATATEPEQIAKLSAALADAKGKATDLITEQAKLARSAQDAVAPLTAQYGATRTLAEVTNQFVLAARASGQAVDLGALAAAQSAKLRALAQDYADATGAAGRQADAQLAINAAFDGSQASLDHVKNYQTAYAKAVEDYTDTTSPQAVAAVAKYTDQLNRGSDASRALADEQASLAAGAGAFSSAFDTIGNSITQALVGGQGAAVNWGNTMSAVLQQVLQQFGKLAILNPLLNGLFGQNNPTLGSVIGALGAVAGPSSTASSSSTGTSALGLLSNASTVGSAANTLTGGWLGNALGITGPNGVLSGITGPSGSLGGLFNGTGLFGANGAVASVANTPLFGSATLGTAATGIGGGFALGSLAGGYLQSALNKTGPAPTIGAGVGAVGGAAIGSIIPGVGTVIGGLLGGLIGGGAGGFIINQKAA